ncbi:putative internal head protein (plasmid) [Escherichia coli]|nr:putative internal head protein [Escherichia coli]
MPREDSFDFLAKTLTNGPFGKYAQKTLDLATSSPDEFRVMLKTQFQKTFPNIAFPGALAPRNGAEHDQYIAGRSR